MHNNPLLSNTTKIVDGIYMGGRIAELSGDYKSATFFGYCGWSPLQLDGEIRNNVWIVNRQANLHDVFNN
jgi:putative AlgH/UPF0301 family transcriptional regulator